jgi:geranylgeranyl reductase family protein
MSPIENADIVVVGAGPAGSLAAEHAALAGAQVLLLERRPKVGVPVRCGEFLPHLEEIKAIFPDAKDVEDIYQFPSDLKQVETERLHIYSPKLRMSEVPFHGFTTERDLFDQHLTARAMKAGAELRTGVRVLGFKGGVLLTDHGDLRPKVVVGADGPLSVIAKSLGLERSKDLCPAVAGTVSGDFEPIPEMYFGNIAPGGYAWVIPKKNRANVGLGYSTRYMEGPLKRNFDAFLEFRGLTVKDRSGKMVPMSGPISRTVAGNALVVGDAASQVMAVNGGGIPIAIICGRIAGEYAARSVRSGASLEEYETQWRREVGGPLRTAARTKSLASLSFGSQWRLEWAMRLLGVKGMGRAIRCQSVPF